MMYNSEYSYLRHKALTTTKIAIQRNPGRRRSYLEHSCQDPDWSMKEHTCLTN